jgi:hypothetical protein
MDSDSAPTEVIEPGRGGLLGSLGECWRHRELLYFLAWRDVKVRYKQTVLGVAWAVLQPVVTMVVFTLVFHRMAGLNAPEGGSYAVFTYAGLLPWLLFQSALIRSSESVVAEARLLTKVYFPRLLVPAATLGSALVDFLVAFAILLGLMACYGVRPGWGMLLLPAFTVLALLSALAVGLWFAALNAKYRDFRHTMTTCTSRCCGACAGATGTCGTWRARRRPRGSGASGAPRAGDACSSPSRARSARSTPRSRAWTCTRTPPASASASATRSPRPWPWACRS